MSASLRPDKLSSALTAALGEFAEASRPNRESAGEAYRARRRAAESVHTAVSSGPRAVALRTLPLVTGPVPSGLILGNSVRTRAPFVLIRHRALLVQYMSAGALRTLVWNPTDVPRALRIPAFDAARRGAGALLAAATLSIHPTADVQLGAMGLSPEAVDVVAFDQLDGQYPPGALARFPRAVLAVTRSEWSRYIDPPPHDHAFLVPGPEVDRARMELVDHALVLGDGVLLLRTGGRREGHQALMVHTARGILVASGNAFAVDGYAPQASRLRGLAEYARQRQCSFVPAFPAVGGESEAAMSAENALADRRFDLPAFPFVIPTVELQPSLLAPGVKQDAIAPDLALGTVSRGK